MTTVGARFRGVAVTAIVPLPSWCVALIADSAERPRTAIADAFYRALEHALFNPRHPIHSQTFGYYSDQLGLAADDQARAARIAASTFSPSAAGDRFLSARRKP
jgi:hypothetical protein